MSKKNLLLLLAALCLVTYLNVLGHGFISDDIPSIVDYPYLGDPLRALREINGSNFLYSLIFLVFGKNAMVYHVVSLIAHWVASYLVFLFIQVLTKDPRLALFSALIFAVHPVHTEAVSWVSASSFIFYTIFFMLTFLAYHSYLEDRQRLYLLATLLCYGGAAFFFSYGVLILLVVLFVYTTYIRQQKISWFYLAFLAIGGLFIWVMRGFIVARVGISEGSRSDLRVIVPDSLTQYLYLLFLPLKLTFYHEGGVMSSFYLWGSRVFALALLTVVPFWLRRCRLAVFFLVFFLASISFSLSPIQIAWWIAERYVYLGSIVGCILWGYLIIWAERKTGIKNLARVLLVLLLGLFTVRTILRNEDWCNPPTFWAATVRASPQSPMAHNNMGDVYFQQRNWEGAISEFEMARKLKPRYAEATYNLALVYLDLGDLAQAESHFLEAAVYDPDFFAPHNRLGEMYAKQGWFDEALVELTRAEELGPDEASVRHNLGTVYQAKGDLERARRSYLEAVRLDSRSYMSFYELGKISYQVGNTEEAKIYLEKAVAIQPDYPPARTLLDDLRGKVGP